MCASFQHLFALEQRDELIKKMSEYAMAHVGISIRSVKFDHVDNLSVVNAYAYLYNICSEPVYTSEYVHCMYTVVMYTVM